MLQKKKNTENTEKKYKEIATDEHPVQSFLPTPIQSFFPTPIQSSFLTGQAGQAGQADLKKYFIVLNKVKFGMGGWVIRVHL